MAFSTPLSSPTAAPPFLPRRAPTVRTSALPPLPLEFPPSPSTLALTTSFAALAFTTITLTDPERRRRQQSQSLGLPSADDKDVVRDYFNNTGFDRWKKIYSDSTDGVNKVQLDIRLGHSKTVENAIQMLKDGDNNDDGSGSRPLSGITICDAGCGTGSLSIPLAREGALVSASDISAAMVSQAEANARNALPEDAPLPKFEVKDLESLEGKYDTVVCLDVLIHYPQEKAEAMIAHLASLAERRLVLSFAPKTFYFDLLKRIGELFPGPSKATRAYLHSERDVERALATLGWTVRKKGFINTQFYFANLIEAVPVALKN